MSRRPTGPGGQASTLYSWLYQRELQAFWAPSGTLPWTPEQPSYTTSSERLAAFKNNEPVDVATSALPQSARTDEPPHWWRRVTVYPNGSTVFRDDESAWLREHDL